MLKRIAYILFALVASITLIACENSSDHIGEAKTPSGSSVMKGRDYNSVVDAFEEKGFTNIRLEAIEDLIFGWFTDDGEVEKVTVDGDEEYSADMWVAEDVEVVIYYHTFPNEKATDAATDEIVDDAANNYDIPVLDDDTKDASVLISNAPETEEQISEVPTDRNITDKPEFSEEFSETAIEETDINPYNRADSFSLFTQTEYAHIDTDIVRLGNGEKLFVTIEAQPATLTLDDFILDYDNTMLEIVGVSSQEVGNEFVIEITIHAIQSGVSDIIIASGYDLFEDADNAEVYVVTVRALDYMDGQLVYVTPTGDKYHFSASCAGPNAITTTYDDALVYEYDPCGSCVG